MRRAIALSLCALFLAALFAQAGAPAALSHPLRVMQLGPSGGGYSAPVNGGPSASLTDVAPPTALQVDGPSVGSDAPAFALPCIDGDMVRLDDYKGRVVVLNFWAFWCDTWKAELPLLSQLCARRDRLGVQVVAVSVDGARLPEFTSRAAEVQVPFPVLLDSSRKASSAYRIAYVPTLVIIDASGRVRYVSRGYPGNHAVLGEVRKLEQSAYRSQPSRGLDGEINKTRCRIGQSPKQHQQTAPSVP